MSKFSFNIDVSIRKNHSHYSPLFATVKNWAFEFDGNNEKDADRAAYEAHLADAMARIAELNGLGVHDLQHLFPAVLRMLKHQSPWSK